VLITVFVLSDLLTWPWSVMTRYSSRHWQPLIGKKMSWQPAA